MPEAVILTGQEFVPHMASKPAMGNVEQAAVYRLSVPLSSYLISPVKVPFAMTYRHLSYPFSPVFAEFEIRLGAGSLQWFLLNARGYITVKLRQGQRRTPPAAPKATRFTHTTGDQRLGLTISTWDTLSWNSRPAIFLRRNL